MSTGLIWGLGISAVLILVGLIFYVLAIRMQEAMPDMKGLSRRRPNLTPGEIQELRTRIGTKQGIRVDKEMPSS